MDLEAVGRHALLFDDDAMAEFTNSSNALVEWNSLSIDHYDVRHLLTDPLPPRARRRHHQKDALESELDLERYQDFLSIPDEQGQIFFDSATLQLCRFVIVFSWICFYCSLPK
ncbi:unnamed protein product [Linum trigynum]|uniref:Suppressor of white apricot N-terminal domain-containing protein n=1 Tax=Linum trigynum TaxID=586398 RepID=A0AAV2G9X7_9ROSI